MTITEVNSDKRGKIHILQDSKLGYPELTIFTTRKGFARGGCIHRMSDEYSSIVSGNVVYRIGDETMYLGSGDSVVIPRNTPHYFISLTDSTVLEWGATPEEKIEKHKESREVVDRINDSAG